jgi:putative chitinase
VKPQQAERHAPAFSTVLSGDALSAGEEELDDFLGQILHESAMLTSARENLNYSPDAIRRVGFGQPTGSRWREAASRAESYAHNPEALGNFVYANRLGNGDEQSGDGYNFRGGGHIMGTGRKFFEWATQQSGVDLVADPDAIEDPETNLRLTLAWWEGHVPDHLSIINDIVSVTKRVNGGQIGIEHRKTITAEARQALENCGV